MGNRDNPRVIFGEAAGDNRKLNLARRKIDDPGASPILLQLQIGKKFQRC